MSNKWTMGKVCLIVLVAMLVAVAQGRAEDAVETDVEMAWDSRYMTEGRDNLDGDWIAGATVETTFRFLAVGAWFGANPESNVRYRELNAWFEIGGSRGDFEGQISYTHLRFLSDQGHDNEIGAGLAYTALPLGLALGAEGYYSFDANGAFYELTLRGEYEALDRLTLAPSATLGFNAGFIEDGHDGANNVALGLEATYRLAQSVHLVAGIAHSWEINADPERYPGDETLKNRLYGRLAMGTTF